MARFAGPPDAGDIDADMVSADLGDDSATHAVFKDAEHTDYAIEAPDRDGGDEPV